MTVALPITVSNLPPTTDPLAAGKGSNYEQNLNIHLICPECKEFPPHIVEEFSSGDLVCGSCGLCFPERIIDTRSEWRTFSNDDGANDDPSRVGDAMNPLLNGSQLETGISGNDAKSRELSKAQSRSTHDKTTKQLLSAYKQITALCDSIGLQKPVQDSAKHLYKLAEENKSLRTKNAEAIIAGCIFIACRQCKVDRTFREIYSLTKVPKKEIGRVFKQLERLMADKSSSSAAATGGAGFDSPGAHNPHHPGTHATHSTSKSSDPSLSYTPQSATSAHDLILRYWNHLGLPQNGTAICEEIAENVSKLGTLDGRSPISSAAACIYFCSHFLGMGKSPREISLIAGVSDGTIRNAYKLIYAVKDKVVNPKWIESGRGKLTSLPGA